jgi:hypothetical protein
MGVVTTVAMVMLLRDLEPYFFCLYISSLATICCSGIVGFMGIIFMMCALL